jgi:hypothetical protein
MSLRSVTGLISDGAESGLLSESYFASMFDKKGIDESFKPAQFESQYMSTKMSISLR